jgi:hypothetical protein
MTGKMFKKNHTVVLLNTISEEGRWRMAIKRFFGRYIPSFILMAICSGCHTRPLPPTNFTEPGWKIQQGQAVWRAKQDATELAGELLFATNLDNRTVLQFTKTPFPFVVAQTTPQGWQLEVPAQNKKYSGSGKAPARISWFHLANAFRGVLPPKPWVFERNGDENWRLINRSSGEMIEGFLAK